MNTRNWSIRSKIVALVAAPIAALLVLWIFATTLTLGPALSLLGAQALLDDVGRPGEAVLAQLQLERRLSVVYLARSEAQGVGQAADLAALRERRSSTDHAVSEFRRLVAADLPPDDDAPLLELRINQFLAALDDVVAARGAIDRSELDPAGALQLYNGAIDGAFRMFSALATLPDAQINRQVRALTDLSQARDVLGRSDALLAGVFVDGTFGPGEYGRLLAIIGTQRFLTDSVAAELSDIDRVAYLRLIETDVFTRLWRVLDRIVTEGSPDAAPPITAADWRAAYEPAQEQLRQFELAAADALTERSTPAAIGILARLGLVGVLGFAAVIASAVISLRVGRSLVQRVNGLRVAALELAGDRLPGVVARLRRGEDVDVGVEAPPLEYGSDELGQLGQAFSEVQRTAVQSAVDEAALRRGLNEVFLNIARRSQTLLHRQLAALDTMERRTTDPQELEDLFRVDHMATRMRRHAEDLAILAGATPGRGWRVPVPMIDVIRAAVSEVEDYPRVQVTTTEPAAVTGRAVSDVIHLLAELIENATSYSPPQTQVMVTGQLVPNGYAIEIEDRGLGMTPQAVEEANRQLAQPPDFDPRNCARLGLFVVAQLGARHRVRVRLRPSAYGGVTAVVLIPADLVVPDSGMPPPMAGPPRNWASSPIELPAAVVTEPATGPDRPAILSGPIRVRAPGGTDEDPHDSPATAGDPDQAGPVGVQPDPVGVGVSGARPTVLAADDPAADDPAADDAAGSEPPLKADLPRRVRQSSLAPQLRGPAEPESLSGSGGDIARRSPQEVRTIMSALQAGTARGRRDAGMSVDIGPIRGTATPPPGTVLSPPPAGHQPSGASGNVGTDPADPAGPGTDPADPGTAGGAGSDAAEAPPGVDGGPTDSEREQ